MDQSRVIVGERRWPSIDLRPALFRDSSYLLVFRRYDYLVKKAGFQRDLNAVKEHGLPIEGRNVLLWEAF